MDKNNQVDSYHKLGRAVIVLFVLVLLCVLGYMLMNSSIDAQLKQNQEIADAANQSYLDEYADEIARAQAEWKELSAAEANPQPATGIGWEIVDLTGLEVANSYQVSMTRQELFMGGMMLVNHWHELPFDFYSVADSETISIMSVDRSIGVKDSSVKVFPVVITALQEMLAAAKDEGIEYYNIAAGYRTQEDQQALYDKAAADYTSRYQGEALRQRVVQSGVNYPGTSEYQSGFSVNISHYKKNDSEFNSISFSLTTQSDWLVENSWKYGFTFRFPLDGYPNASVTGKSFKTGINSKLMVYRYVGKGHATVMHILNMCMEEYIEYLMEHPHIKVYEDGELRYEITREDAYYEYGAIATVSADADEYTVSMDNLSENWGGVIVCMSY